MNSSRPYLLRALYEWIVDNNCTPHLLVAAEYPGARVPAGYAKDGQIVLNVSPSAVRYLEMGNEVLTFEGRFGGVAQSLYIPVAAVQAIYARENGEGMSFVPEGMEEGEGDEGPSGDDEPPRPSGRPSLKVVK
ncbi:MAG: ClpXP protease specificity-enhancing factor [Pseudomonas sp.]|nr:ClpXP protease specificity-enhancing factor [Pseudomonas sp.]